jgi:NADPH:quinone reductase-like Zn-dependent oxidoreductase
VDSSGGETLRKALDVVRPGGRIAIYGGTSGDATIKLFPLFWKHVTILGTSMGSPQDFAAMLELFRKGLRPVVDRVFSLRDAAAAMQHLANAEQFGKVVLRID